MKVKHIVFLLIATAGLFYMGMFLGDLGGIGGYDGVAPRWLYEKVNRQPGDEVLSQLAEKGAIISLGVGLVSFTAFVICLFVFIVKKVKSLCANS